MEELIPVVNKLRDVFATVGSDPVDLPQIVVVGTQSSGKSSVLEGIVGRDFLPRGTGIVTRRPLVLQLVNTPSSAPEAPSEWAEFNHRPGERFTDFRAVRAEIAAETDRVTGSGKCISRLPITLRIFSPTVVDLTLVDLPGITRVPTGDQPADIEEQVRSMVLEYIARQNAIVLAVTAANTDISTSDALQLARQVDPRGERTLGVVTKLDLMDRGTDALDVLSGMAIPLRLGYVGVVCRGQRDIEADKSVAAAAEDEHRFFQSHPKYRLIASRCGSRFLARTLNSLLLSHIRKTLPEIKLRVGRLLSEAQAEYASLDGPLSGNGTPESRGAALLNLLTRFSTDYVDAVTGRMEEMPANELFGGARLRHVFDSIFSKQIDAIEPLQGLAPRDILAVIRNAAGARPTLFVPDAAFEMLVKRQVDRLREPSLECVDLVYEELHKVLEQVEEKDLAGYSRLRDAVVEVVHGLLASNRSPARDMVTNLIRIETAFINTSHPDFIGGDRAIAMVNERLNAEMAVVPGSIIPAGMPTAAAAAAAALPAAAGQIISAVGGLSAAAQTQMSVRRQQQQLEGPARCPICDKELPNDLKEINAHVDECCQAKKEEDRGAMDHTDETQQSGFLSWFSSNPKKVPPSAIPPSKGKSPSPAPAPALAAKEKERPPSYRAAVQSPSSAPTPTPSPSQQGVPLSTTAAAAAAAVRAAKQGRMVTTISQKERYETELIRVLLESYFGVVKKTIKDSVPKTVMYFLVGNTIDALQQHLVHTLYKEDRLAVLLEESPEVIAKRAACKQTIDVLQRATQIIQDVRDDSFKKFQHD